MFSMFLLFCILYFILIDNTYMYKYMCLIDFLIWQDHDWVYESCLFENNTKSKLDKNG